MRDVVAAKGKVKTINLETQRKRRKQRFLGYCRGPKSKLTGRRKGLANVTTPKILCYLCYLCVSRFMVLTLF